MSSCAAQIRESVQRSAFTVQRSAAQQPSVAGRSVLKKQSPTLRLRHYGRRS